MEFSKHYKYERRRREYLLTTLEIGETIHKCLMYDSLKDKYFIYEISEKAILTIKAEDNPNFIITRYPARPSRIKKYWRNAPNWLIEISAKYSRERLTY